MIDLVVCSAAEALGEIGSETALPSLIEAYKSNEDVRLPVVESLGKIGGTKSLNYLIDYLQTDDPMILFAVIDAIGIDILSLEDETNISAKGSITNHSIIFTNSFYFLRVVL